MSRLLQNVRDTAAVRRAVEEDLDTAIIKAKRRHSWGDIAEAARMTRSGVRHRYLAAQERAAEANGSVSEKETTD
jgi:hypothetical protein